MSCIKEKLSAFLPDITDLQETMLIKYLDLLLDSNSRINLTAITSREEAVTKHLADSLAAISLLPYGASLLDIGSGGGCPALPLKIVRPDLDLTMTDSVGKKVRFLNTAVSELGLQNARALQVRAEEYARTAARESFDIVTARAVAALPILLELAIPLAKPDGRFLAYKIEKSEELAAANRAASLLQCRLIAKKDYVLDEKHARTILVYQKSSAVDDIYPRPFAKIQKHPL